MHTETTMRFSLIAVALAVSTATLCAQTGGPFDLSWHTFDGGGTCAGGVGLAGGARFSLSGTTGQPDAGTCLGGNYQLGGGFVSAFQKVTGPELKIIRTGNAVILTWSAGPCGGFHLIASANVAGGPWVDVVGGAGQLSGNGNERFVTLPESFPYQFFHLRKACAGGCSPACRE